MKRIIFALLIAILARTVQAEPRTVFVQLFEWPWKDIATECETYLGPNGFSAVQVSPPQEHIKTENNFWWERYQPVSYNILSRSGTEDEFKDMVNRCHNAGVDIYVDAVINHMSGFEQGTGFSGSSFTHFEYPGLYTYDDFHHCNRNGDDNIVHFNDRYELFNCELLNLADLNTGSSSVQKNIVNYLNRLTDYGVQGFRIDAAKHMDPQELIAIKNGLKGSPYILQELILNPGEPLSYTEYAPVGDVNVFAFPFLVGQAFKQQKLGALRHINLGLPKSDDAVIFIDNHDLQRISERTSLITYQEDPTTFRLSQVFLLTWPYGYPQIFSSFKMNTFDQGPPVNELGYTKSILDDQNNCNENWICEHRLPEVPQLVKFRNSTDNYFYITDWWSNGVDQIAYSRGSSGFVIINNSSQALEREFQTSLPQGQYCNLAEAINSKDRNCDKLYTVDAHSQIKISLPAKSALVMLNKKRIKSKKKVSNVH